MLMLTEERRLRMEKVKKKRKAMEMEIKMVQPTPIDLESIVFPEDPKILCLMAVHGRREITIETINMLKSQTYPIEVLIVGDSAREKDIAAVTGSLYVQRTNKPLGKKWQEGLYSIRRYDPDAVMICGSDSWITPKWCEIAIPILKTGVDLVGINTFHACKINPGEKVQIIKRANKGIRKNIPMGSGRIFSRKFLESIKWKLFPVHKNKGMDIHSIRKLRDKKGHVVIMDDPALKIVSIKSTWESINSWDTYIKSTRNEVLPDIKNPKKWLANNFPNSIKALERVVDDIVW